MKKILLLSIFIFSGAVFSSKANAQTTADYTLLPGSSFMLPVGQQVTFTILWHDSTGALHEGAGKFASVPAWTVNGHPAGKQNPEEGTLSSADLTFAHNTYTAPASIPPVNPVTIAVAFQSSDSSKERTTLLCNVKIIKPRNLWYVAFTCSQFTSATDITEGGDTKQTRTSQASGNVSMLIYAQPPDKKGNVIINVGEGDTVVSYSSSGHAAVKFRRVEKDGKEIVSKRLTSGSGSASKEKTGIEFEYNPSDKGVSGLEAAGLGFKCPGRDKIWMRNGGIEQDKLVLKSDDAIDIGPDIQMGSDEDVLKKIKDGFTIDYSQSKDTAYTGPFGRDTHKEQNSEQYHMVILWEKGGK